MQLLRALTRAVIHMLCVAHIVIAMFVRRAIIGVFDYGFVMPLGGGGCLEDKRGKWIEAHFLRFKYGDIIAY
jgi:hypothetical protein